MRFIPHSSSASWTVSVEGENISIITDKLIRLAAKNTEHYASDIVHEINALREAVKAQRPMNHYLAFRDSGVNCYMSAKHMQPDINADINVVQWWRLCHEPDHGAGCRTILIRQDLVE